MSVHVAVRESGPGWFVRTAAVCAALANLVVQVAWFGGLETLAGDGAYIRDAVPSALLAVISGLLTAQLVLWKFALPGRDYWHRYWIVVGAFCLEGAVMGELLGWLWVLDGTLGAGTFADVLAQGTPAVVATLAGALLPGLVGAVLGLLTGLAEGLVVAFPLASVLGSFERAR